jgi:hypothetical protein
MVRHTSRKAASQLVKLEIFAQCGEMRSPECSSHGQSVQDYRDVLEPIVAHTLGPALGGPCTSVSEDEFKK